MIRFIISLFFAAIAVVVVVGTLARDSVASMIPPDAGAPVDAASVRAAIEQTSDDAVLGSGPSANATMVDVVENPPAEDARTRLWRSGATVAALIVGLQRLLMVLIAWPKPERPPENIVQRVIVWIKTGSRVTYLAAFAGGVAVIAEPASRGTTPSISMAMVAVSVVIALLAAPSPRSTAATKEPS